ncbi:MAG TPA: DUF2807 domain-containing protein [Bacteroidales bacterium]|nr:DUF2807 domain-containing protein [Bacteroidales bacterium]HQB56190.1 DUF2807 domain-containing protein [Bacteroidales bacterium]
MKKLVAIFVTIFLCSAVQAQNGLEKRKFQVEAFSGLELSGVMEATVERSASHTLFIETYPDVFEYLEVKVSRGVLHIGFIKGGLPRAIQRKYRSLEITCKVTLPVLSSLELSGVTKVYVKDDFKTDKMDIELSGVTKADLKYMECSDLEVEVSGVSELKMNGQADQVNIEISGASKGFFVFEGKTVTFAGVEISGSGNATLKGKAVRSFLDISGAAAFEGRDFEVEVMKAAVSGVSKAQVRVLGSLEPEVSGASKLHYNRNASLRNVNTSGAARLTSY